MLDRCAHDDWVQMVVASTVANEGHYIRNTATILHTTPEQLASFYHATANEFADMGNVEAAYRHRAVAHQLLDRFT